MPLNTALLTNMMLTISNNSKTSCSSKQYLHMYQLHQQLILHKWPSSIDSKISVISSQWMEREKTMGIYTSQHPSVEGPSLAHMGRPIAHLIQSRLWRSQRIVKRPNAQDKRKKVSKTSCITRRIRLSKRITSLNWTTLLCGPRIRSSRDNSITGKICLQRRPRLNPWTNRAITLSTIRQQLTLRRNHQILS